jgi:hypothetical protein
MPQNRYVVCGPYETPPSLALVGPRIVSCDRHLSCHVHELLLLELVEDTDVAGEDLLEGVCFGTVQRDF